MAAEQLHRSPSPPFLLVLKGHPGTGKSTLARAIAGALRCPLLDKDDIRDATRSLEQFVPRNLLNELSYASLFRIAATQLRLHLPAVVLDSPLSRPPLLDSLREIAAPAGARIVVVDCRAEDETEWRRRVEERGSGRGDGGSWHKPATWGEVRALVESYQGCTEYEITGDVDRIVVDTTASGEDPAARVLEFIGGLVSHSP